MKTIQLVITAVTGALLAFGMAVQGAEQKGEVVELKSLPAAVQKMITDKAAGGEITRVSREDDKSGKWNYEVMVKSDGKEWGFEIDPNGKLVKKHDDHTKTEKH